MSLLRGVVSFDRNLPVHVDTSTRKLKKVSLRSDDAPDQASLMDGKCNEARDEIVEFLTRLLSDEGRDVRDAGNALAVYCMEPEPNKRVRARKIAEEKIEKLSRTVAYDPIFDENRHVAISQTIERVVMASLDALNLIGIGEELDEIESAVDGETGGDGDES